ncbi:MAG: hypothetical protein GC150_17865 [Rhizobiales bacterium]|nr:hypothetical protein [Hyphomicrobiales bacterium]
MSSSKLFALNRRSLLQGAAAGALVGSASPWVGVLAAEAACGTLRAGITGYSVVNTLDPGKASLIPEFYLIWGIFNTLLKFDEGMNLVGDLAESWEATSPTVWRFKLRQGVKFHDGKPCTADDVKFTIDRLRNPDFGSPHKGKFDSVKEVRAIDSHTVEFETNTPFAPLLGYLTNTRTGSQIVPRHILEGGDAEAFARQPIGTGAYKLTKLEPNVSVSLAANTDYFISGQPTASQIEVPLIPEESSGVTALLGGTIDLTSTAPFADIPNLSTNAAVKVLKSGGLNTRFIELNHRVAPFDDVHFRRACAFAFDRNALVQVVLFGEGQVANGLIPAALSWAHSSSARATSGFDAERAKAELAKSKYGAGTEAVVLTWGAGWWKRFAEVFVAQVNETLGTKLRVEVSEANTVYSRLKAHDYQASIWGWLGLVDPDEYCYEILHTKGWRNFRGYSNASLDALIEQARGESDQAARGELYRKIEDMMAEDVPVLTCFESNVHNLLSPKVEGFVQLPYSGFGGQFAAVTSC